MKDERIVYGATCTWWDSIDKVGLTHVEAGVFAPLMPMPGHRLPCCPKCGGVLYELPTEADWFKGVDRYEHDGHPGYRAMTEWARGKCFPNHEAMTKAYNAFKRGEN
jgi:hypothetical protein